MEHTKLAQIADTLSRAVNTMLDYCPTTTAEALLVAQQNGTIDGPRRRAAVAFVQERCGKHKTVGELLERTAHGGYYRQHCGTRRDMQLQWLRSEIKRLQAS